MESPESNDGFPIKLDLQQVHRMISDALPAWCCKAIEPGDGIILDTIHACNSEEQHKLMLVFPEAVMAYTLFMMSRNSSFINCLMGKENSGALDRMLEKLKEIKEAEDREEAREAQEGDAGNLEQQAVH